MEKLFVRGYDDKDTLELNDIMRTIIRKIYSSPRSDTSSLIQTILSNEELEKISKHYKLIINELKIKLVKEINADFTDIIKQKIMFYYSNLSVPYVENLQNKAIFLLDNRYVSLTRLNETNMN